MLFYAIYHGVYNMAKIGDVFEDKETGQSGVVLSIREDKFNDFIGILIQFDEERVWATIKKVE